MNKYRMTMKKSVYVIMAMMLLSFVACNRFRPRVNHSEQMEQVRIPALRERLQEMVEKKFRS